ncbi:quinone-dependent dihydroorotate dehydrogenase [Ferruginibacter sp. HRS2-29]|nr:quinone-dependent dihydroorotate dehydrogenase [Ferruginibacter sp. HRS2-29]MCP9752140.1 quinone-dependent dihydroorotate dehydrogenase [Ferruginibacter sp. HRS2-29]
MYNLLRSFLFLFDPEKVHYFSMNALKKLCSIGFIRKAIIRMYTPVNASGFSLFNLHFRNRVGLGAGFDKNARYLEELECLGFGFVEIGTVTPLPQDGNDKPRLFRLPKDKSLINRMGFNNDGADAIVERLKKWRVTAHGSGVTNAATSNTSPETLTPSLIIGGNIGKNKVTPNETAWKDYETCFKKLHPYVDYFVVNVSSPNTPGLRELQEKDALRKILTTLQQLNPTLPDPPKPILLKIAPDLTREQIDDVISLALEIKLDGLVAANTTIDRSLLSDASKLQCEKIGAGGLSGKTLKKRSTEIVKYITEKTGGSIPVIASGGIFTGADAEEKFASGASLVQVWTGFIYEGPGIVRKITEGNK